MIEKPEMIFPCTCMGEGLVVVKRDDIDDIGIDVAFWQFGQVNGKWGWLQRFRFIWQIIKTGHPYTDMVMLDDKVAKHLAHHILYLLDKKKKQDQTNMIVRDLTPEQEQKFAENIQKGFQELAAKDNKLNLPMDQIVIPGFRIPEDKTICSNVNIKGKGAATPQLLKYLLRRLATSRGRNL